MSQLRGKYARWPLRLSAKDIGFSSREDGFDSRMGHCEQNVAKAGTRVGRGPGDRRFKSGRSDWKTGCRVAANPRALGARRRRFDSCHPDMKETDVGRGWHARECSDRVSGRPPRPLRLRACHPNFNKRKQRTTTLTHGGRGPVARTRLITGWRRVRLSGLPLKPRSITMKQTRWKRIHPACILGSWCNGSTPDF